MHYALMQNVFISTNMNVRKHFIKCAILNICIEKCVERELQCVHSNYLLDESINNILRFLDL